MKATQQYFVTQMSVFQYFSKKIALGSKWNKKRLPVFLEVLGALGHQVLQDLPKTMRYSKLISAYIIFFIFKEVSREHE